MQISNINNLAKISDVPRIGDNTKTTGSDFANYLKDALDKVNDLQIESTNLTESFLMGETDNIHNVMIAGSKANLALQMTIQVRNKVLP